MLNFIEDKREKILLLSYTGIKLVTTCTKTYILVSQSKLSTNEYNKNFCLDE